MKIRYIPIHNGPSTYEARLELPKRSPTEPREFLPICRIVKSAWCHPISETRWEFQPASAGDARHPLCNQYPNTLKEAKRLLSEWVARCIINGTNQPPLRPHASPYHGGQAQLEEPFTESARKRFADFSKPH